MTQRGTSNSGWRGTFLYDQRLNILSGWGSIIVIGGAALALVLVVIAIAIGIDSRNCGYAGRQLGHRTHYDLLAGCYVDVGGQAVPLDQYRAISPVR